LFEQPQDVLARLEEVLARSGTVDAGRRFRRLWHVGNRVFDHKAGTLTGMVGWARSDQALASAWDEERQSWAGRIVPGGVSAVAPFAFTTDSRYLGVLRPRFFTETTVATVFRDLLNRDERFRPTTTTDWDVEPVGDEQEFYQSVATTDRILNGDFR
jgi:hypothetical protein